MPEGAFAVGTVTRLMPSKGNQYLLEAIPSVLAVEPETRFYIVGEGELRGELEAQARALGLADRVTFVGFMRDVSVAYAACDLVVFPSLWEGTPLTAFEALAMGRPIVATDCDGLLDILTPDSDARIVPRRDAGALAEAIIALRRDPETRERLGRQARKTGATYDIGEFVRKMEAALRADVCAVAPDPPRGGREGRSQFPGQGCPSDGGRAVVKVAEEEGEALRFLLPPVSCLL